MHELLRLAYLCAEFIALAQSGLLSAPVLDVGKPSTERIELKL